MLIDGVEWATVEAHGAVPGELLADRPVEERDRPFWLVRWALPEGGDVPGTLHAPTPTDEPLGLPALLIASFPLAPDRRHVASGPLTDFLVERAADAYVRLLGARPAEPGVLGLVPGPVAAGELDARLRRAIAERLPEAPVLPGGVRGRDALVVDAPAPFVELLGGHGDGPAVFGGLLPGGWPARRRRSRRSGCGGSSWPTWWTSWRRSSGNRPGGTGCTRPWTARTRRRSARCPSRSRTIGWCGGRAGC
ncbi:hypothetical protein BJF79_33835 [Actinomadura sp. CNU-125]|nr:hypothetical protein BJF79_33835 [Actinomadura sp. CNU-125]